MDTMKYLMASAGFLFALQPGSADAQSVQWMQDSTLQGMSGPGCAEQIAVGPNNVPWVIGCSGPGDNGANKSIYYLNYTSCNGDCFGYKYSWVYAGGAAVQISVTVWGEALAVTSNGHIWGNNYAVNSAGIMVPSGSWTDDTVSANGDGCVALGGLVTQAVALTGVWPIDEQFVTSNTYAGLSRCADIYWAIGSGSGANELFVLDEPLGQKSWSPSIQGATGSQLAVFNFDSPSTGITQTPWIINSKGSVFSYNGTGFGPEPGTNVYAITDHFMAAPTASSFSTIFQWSDSAEEWVSYMSGITPNSTIIEHIASSQTINDGGLVIGPTNLWGIDTSGHIFYAQTNVTPR